MLSESTSEEMKKGGTRCLILVIVTVAHTLFYFAPDLHLPLDLAGLFLLGSALVLVDSSLIVFLAIKFSHWLHSKNE